MAGWQHGWILLYYTVNYIMSVRGLHDSGGSADVPLSSCIPHYTDCIFKSYGSNGNLLGWIKILYLIGSS